jgi:hypothetical protein
MMTPSGAPASGADLATAATRVYVWGSALVGAMRLRQNITQPADPFGARPASSAAAPMNRLGHQRQLSDPRLTVGVAPNVDTLYTLAWLDTSGGPFVFETPDFGDRYYTFQIGYADTECDICPGQRTHGRQLPPMFIHNRSYEGPVPDGMLDITSRTRYVMIGGRVLVLPEDPDDPARVNALQAQMRLRTLERWNADDVDANPVPTERRLPSADDVDDADLLFLHQLGAVLVEDPTHQCDSTVLAALHLLGLEHGAGFDPAAIPAHLHGDVVAGLRAGEALVDDKIGHLGQTVNGWSVNLQGSIFGDDDLLRAAVAKNQIYVVPAEEAVYPVARADRRGRRLDGRHRYTLRLDETPPTDAFWSLTVYGTPGPLVANTLGRYAIGDRSPGLRYDADGALTILLQHDEPDDGPTNWLPVPNGQFHVMMRLYWPQPSVLAGHWAPPPIDRASTDA